MAASLTSPVSIINLIELALSVIIGGLLANLMNFPDVSKNQFIVAGIYGYLIINIIIVGALILKEEISKNTRLAIAGIGFIVYLTAGALLLEYFDNNQKWLQYDDDKYGRILSAGIISLALAVAYIADCFLVFKS